ncbi:MAG: hypothetical protein ACI8S6_001006 [Myxococcota bacterium]|jgi:hypothetical protein
MRRWLIRGLTLVGVAWAGNALFCYSIGRFAHERQLAFDATSMQEVQSAAADWMASAAEDPSFAPLSDARAFREVFVLDDDAHSWSNMSSLFGGAGATIFDANGDGRLDLYLTHDGQNWTRPTDEDAVLLDTPRYTANGLYLNQGNRPDGSPIFVQVSALVTANDTHVAAELLVEDYLEPRQTTADSTQRWGRQSNLALAADLNGDGRPDLLVGNQPPGMPWSHPDTQRVLSRFVDPIGRQARQSKQPLVALGMHLVPYSPRQSLNDTRSSSRGEESEGANSLYINLGDTDGDGIPEWQDVSRAAGIEGFRPSYGLSALDFDLDGDLDIFVANSHDLDFWPGGSNRWAGGINTLYVNQLAQTGELRFIEQGEALGITGEQGEDNRPYLTRLGKIPGLPIEYSIAAFYMEEYKPELLEMDGGPAENAGISWASVVQDYDSDGWPDIWVANDLGFLKLYRNIEGERFEAVEHARSETTGSWMSFAMADFNGDLQEDAIIGNAGGGAYNHAFIAPNWYDMEEPVIADSLAFRTLVISGNDFTHGIIDGADVTRELPNRIRHSSVLPPETALANNIRPENIPKASFIEDYTPFDPTSLDPYEFAWGMTPIDIQNDGRMDMYTHGCLWNRGGGVMAVIGTSPGRLLVNATPQGGELRFVDLTAEHHLFSILELQYDRLEDEGYVYRKAPQQNWKKRDWVYSYDRSVWTSQGVGIQERVTNNDLLQTAEFGKATVAADLNGDGFQDLLLTSMGGYDSRSSTNANLKVMIDGQPQVLPPPDNNYPTLTNFEPGLTRTFLNPYTDGGFVEVVLIGEGYNLDAIGARVVVNDALMRVRRAGDGGFIGNTLAPLHIGLGEDSVETITVTWPDRAGSTTHLQVDQLRNGRIIISQAEGLVDWTPR